MAPALLFSRGAADAAKGGPDNDGRRRRTRAPEGRAVVHAPLPAHAHGAVAQRVRAAVATMTAPKRNTTVYLYELAWILPSIAIPVGMLAALAVTAFGAGIRLPSAEGRIDPA